MVALAWVPDPFSAKHPPTVLHSSSWKSKFLQEFVIFRNAVFLLTSHVQSLLSIAWEAGTTIPQIWFSIEGSEPKNVTLPRLWLHVWVTVHSGLFMIGLQFLTHLYSIIHMLQLSGFIHLLLSKFAKLRKLKNIFPEIEKNLNLSDFWKIWKKANELTINQIIFSKIFWFEQL